MQKRIGVSLAVGLASLWLVGAAEGKTSRHFNTSVYTCCATTASGMRFNKNNPHIIAHKSYKFGTRLILTNLANGRTQCVVVEDRGPFVRGREYDVTPAVARQLGFRGLALVSARRADCFVPAQYLNPKRR